MGESNTVTVMVYGVVGFMSIVVAVLAVAAEATKIKVSDIFDTGTECIYPNTSANILGYTAAVVALIAQITISAVTHCVCCQKDVSKSTSVGATVSFVFSWVACTIGIDLLASAANLSTRHEHLDAQGICYTVKSGIFTMGGGLALVAGILGLFAYYLSNKYSQQQPPGIMPYYHHQGGIAMAHPQFHAAAPNPYPYPYPYPKQQHDYNGHGV